MNFIKRLSRVQKAIVLAVVAVPCVTLAIPLIVERGGQLIFPNTIVIAGGGSILPLVTNSQSLGAQGQAWNSILLTSGLRNGADNQGRYTIADGAGNIAFGEVANTGTNAAHVLRNLVALSGSTRILQFESDSVATVRGWVDAIGMAQFNGGTTLGTNGTTISDSFAASATIDFASTSNTTADSSNITVTGAAVGDGCVVGVPVAAQVAGAIFTCLVTATDTVVVRLGAIGAGIDPASGSFTVRTVDP